MEILFEDPYLLVINKPSGIIVNKAETTKGQETVQDWVETNYLQKTQNTQRSSKSDHQKLRKPESLNFRYSDVLSFPSIPKIYDPKEEFYSRGGIVHRLDKETSGVLVIAKTPESFADLKQQFMQRQVKKIYLALAHGQVIPDKGIISVPVGRLPYNRMRFGILPGGRDSYTAYKTTMNYELRVKNKTEMLSLLELYPKTGRTHQIRIHLQYLHHPIFGDKLYAGRKTARNDRKLLPRIFLHAYKLSFCHPLSGKEMTITAELPIELNEFLEKLKVQS